MTFNQQLIEAAQAGNVDQIKEALNQGADVNAAGEGDFPALHYALRIYPHNHEKPVMEVVRCLVEAGAEINRAYAARETPFMTACIEGNPEAVSYLFEKGNPDLNARLENGNSLLDELAIKMKNRPRNFTMTKTVDGKAVTLTDPDEIRKAIGSHPDDEFFDYLKVATFLLEKGIDPDTKNPNQQTALFTAVGAGVEELAMLLIEKGAEVNFKDKWGTSVLHFACRGGYNSMVDALLAAGADINAGDNWGFTPLHEAVMSALPDTVQKLIEHGVNLNQGLTQPYDAEHPMGTTPLMIAEKKGLTTIVELLKK